MSERHVIGKSKLSLKVNFKIIIIGLLFAVLVTVFSGTAFALPVLTIEKSAIPQDGSSVSPTSTITYKLSYANTGVDTATGVTITDKIPNDTTFLGATDSGFKSGFNVIWNSIGDISPGETGYVRISVAVNSPLVNGTPIDSLAGDCSIDSNETDPVYSSNSLRHLAYINPHDRYNAKTGYCKECHMSYSYWDEQQEKMAVSHENKSQDATLAMPKDNEKKLCYVCHGFYNNSQTDIKSGTRTQTSDFGENTLDWDAIGTPEKVSYHPVEPLETNSYPKDREDNNGKDKYLRCSNCHETSNHNTIGQAKLLRAGPKKVKSGNEFCFVCHGDPDNDNANPKRAGYYMGGDHQTNYSASAHSDLTWRPASGTNIQCLNCHTQHGSNTNFLIDFRLQGTYPEEKMLCYSNNCHNIAASSWNGQKNIQAQFSKTSKHELDFVSGENHYTECESCHNSHFNKQVSTGQNDYWKQDRASNPSNTTQLMSAVEPDSQKWATVFCLKCHTNSSDYPNRIFKSTTVVPYNITFPNMGGSTFFPGWNKFTNDIGGGSGFTDVAATTAETSSGHYSLDFSGGVGTNTRVGCDNCHDPHASDNNRLIAFSGTANETDHAGISGIFRDNSNIYKEEKLCLKCHEYPTGNNCSQGGCHTTKMKNIGSDGGDNEGSLYVAVGGSSSIYKWAASVPDTWTQMSDAPSQFDAGSSLLWANSKYIYSQMGGGTPDYNVYKIADNGWADPVAESGIVMSDMETGTVGSGGSMVWDNNSQFFAFSGSDTSNLHRYSFGGDKWDRPTAAAAPSNITTGGTSVYARDPQYYAGADDKPSEFIFVLKGGLTNTFWKYQINNNFWNPDKPGGGSGDPKDVVDNGGNPLSIEEGASMVWTGDDHIYLLRGGGTNDFLRYKFSTISETDSWTELQDTPYPISAGGSLTFDGDKYIYAIGGIDGLDSKKFMKYNTQDNTWQTLNDLPVNITSGSSSVFLRKSIHPYKKYSGSHTDTETGGSASFGYNNDNPNKRHSECDDCHDSHAAKEGTNGTNGNYGTPDGNKISNALLGSFGLNTVYVDFLQIFTVERLTGNSNFQYELCFKCHSSYTGGPGAGFPGSQTDIAAEFRPANASQHAVVDTDTVTPNTFINQNTMNAPFAATYAAGDRATLACSDCHSKSDEPRGSHGSDKPNILKEDADLELCLTCHKTEVYSEGSSKTESNFDHTTKAWVTYGTNPDVHFKGRYCRNCHAGRMGDLHGTNTRELFMTGVNITGWTPRTTVPLAQGKCTTNENCHNLLGTPPTRERRYPPPPYDP